jgi:hypothetical protein
MRTIDLVANGLTRIDEILARIETALEETTKAATERSEDQTSYLRRIDTELRSVRNSIERCQTLLRKIPSTSS